MHLVLLFVGVAAVIGMIVGAIEAVIGLFQIIIKKNSKWLIRGLITLAVCFIIRMVTGLIYMSTPNPILQNSKNTTIPIVEP